MGISTSLQPGLPFEFNAINDSTLRAAYARSRLTVPFESALRDRALSICLNRVAETLLKQRRRRHG